jgi:hypothetical protein
MDTIKQTTLVMQDRLQMRIVVPLSIITKIEQGLIDGVLPVGKIHPSVLFEGGKVSGAYHISRKEMSEDMR